MYNLNSGYGQALAHALHGIIPTFGRIFIVMDADSTDEENYQRMQETFAPDPGGKVRFYTTVAEAYAQVESNNDDVILLDASDAHPITEMLTVSNNRTHFVGCDGGNRLIQQGSRLVMGVTGVATDLAPVLVTGTRNTFRNIKVENASTTDESLYGFIENGEGTYLENFMACKTAGLNDANHAHFWMAGDACSGRNLTFGHSTLQSTAAGFGILIDAKSGGADHVKENFLKDVRINMSVDNGVVATSCFIKIADNAAMLFNNVIEELRAYNFAPPGESEMTDAVLAAASTTAGVLYLVNPVFMGCAGVGAGSGYGVNIAAGGLAPDADGGLDTALTD
uniref:Uncharacterized protein n=1 Tax=viral metagenome TaxID=1070528 RepID=A0A6M3LNQ9_9ZZZZ